MINDIESGRINTVVIKTSRALAESMHKWGLYIEHYFEQKGVRFVTRRKALILKTDWTT